MARIRGLEGARGVAAVGVLSYHVGQLTPRHGWLAASSSRLWLGVPLFFVLSGYLLFGPFAAAAINGCARPNLRRYGKSRMLRIAPAYWTVLTATILLQSLYMLAAALAAGAITLWAVAYVTRSRVLSAVVLTGIAIAALFAVRGEVAWAGLTNYFLVYVPVGPYGLVGPAWTLCIEVSFYVALPLIALAAARLARTGSSREARGRRLAVLLAVLVPAGPIYLSYAGDNGPLPVWLPGFIGQFAAGMLLAVAAELRPAITRRSARAILLGAVAVAAVANLVYGVGAPGAYGNGSGVLFAPLMATAFALALASVVMCDGRTLLGRLLASRVAVALGTISYGIYLWHFLLIQRFIAWGLWGNENENLALVGGSTLLIATISWLLIERPALRLKNRVLPPLWRRDASRRADAVTAPASSI